MLEFGVKGPQATWNGELPRCHMQRGETGTQGMSLSAWFLIINVLALKYKSSSNVGSKAWTFMHAFVDSGYCDYEAQARWSIPNPV